MADKIGFRLLNLNFQKLQDLHKLKSKYLQQLRIFKKNLEVLVS